MLSSFQYSLKLQMPIWEIQKLEKAGILPAPVRIGRTRVYTDDQVKHALAALKKLQAEKAATTGAAG